MLSTQPPQPTRPPQPIQPAQPARDEAEHLAIVRRSAPESMVLLRSDGAFPLRGTGALALYGSGARRTLKGGTGSGDVNSRHVVTIEEGLEKAGFTLTTKAWLDAYEALYERTRADFIADIKAGAKAAGVPAVVHGMGAVMLEPEHDLPLGGEGAGNEIAAVYVLARVSGEGSDRRPERGDVLLTDAEVRDILALNERYEKFLLVLNVGGVADLTPVKDVGNILLLSQLGAAVGDAFADVLLGRAYPSGRLSTTWAAWEDYSAVGDFGDPDDTHYREGVYVGYRYFDSTGTAPLFPFGFGLGYTSFELAGPTVTIDGSRVTARVRVTNTGERAGKEVVQVYVSVPPGRLDQPYQALAGFEKSAELAPGERQEVAVAFDLTDLASYDEARAATVLEAGDYVVRVGASSRDTAPAAVIRLARTGVVRELHDVLGDPGFTDWRPADPTAVEVPDDAPRLTVEAADLRRADRCEPVDLAEALEFVKELSDDELSYIVLGDYRDGAESAESQSIIGAAAQTLVGAAGQTTTRFADLPSLIRLACASPPRSASMTTAPSRWGRHCRPTSTSSWMMRARRRSGPWWRCPTARALRSASWSSTPPPFPSAPPSPSPGIPSWRSLSAISWARRWTASVRTCGWPRPSICTARSCAGETSSTSRRIRCWRGAWPPASPAACKSTRGAA